jgi:hypothetical protein
MLDDDDIVLGIFDRYVLCRPHETPRALHNAPDASPRPCGVGLRGRWVRRVPVCDVLGDIALHVEQAEGARALGVGAHSGGMKPRRGVPLYKIFSSLGLELPQGCRKLFGPRAANSHSASVGSRLPAHEQYARAAVQLTQFAG